MILRSGTSVGRGRVPFRWEPWTWRSSLQIRSSPRTQSSLQVAPAGQGGQDRPSRAHAQIRADLAAPVSPSSSTVASALARDALGDTGPLRPP